MIRNLMLVAKREYVKMVRRPTFWIATLAFPLLVIAMSLISGLSAQSFEDQIKRQAQSAEAIYVVDRAQIVSPNLVTPPLLITSDEEAAIAKLVAGEATAVIVYPEDLLEKREVQLFVEDQGLLAGTGFEDMARSLINQSILLQLDNPKLIEIFNSGIQAKTTTYKDGQEISRGWESFIVPGVGVAIYFVLITFASGYLLLSVSEEKENRMIETILSIVTPRELVWGKIVGQLGIILTQLLLLISLALGGLLVFGSNINLDLSQVAITPGQVLASIFFIVTGFLINANIMVGVGSAMPSYRDAQSLSSVFIFASLIPIYLASTIVAEPSGTLAIIFSYFPFTSPLILLFRSALGELYGVEAILGPIAVLIYVAISFVLAFKLFEIGALEYRQRINLSTLFLGKKRRQKHLRGDN